MTGDCVNLVTTTVPCEGYQDLYHVVTARRPMCFPEGSDLGPVRAGVLQVEAPHHQTAGAPRSLCRVCKPDDRERHADVVGLDDGR